METLQKIADMAALCTKCSLHNCRTNIVAHRGSSKAEVMFVGEAPGREEDAQGLPFVGRAGKLLDNMIVAMGYGRDDVFVANICKCRPPENRKPLQDEMDACLPYLQSQIDLVAPKVIITLGATATEGLLGRGPGITKRRGKWEQYEGIPVMPTLHPAYLLRNPAAKHDVWEDLQKVMKMLGKHGR